MHLLVKPLTETVEICPSSLDYSYDGGKKIRKLDKELFTTTTE